MASPRAPPPRHGTVNVDFPKTAPDCRCREAHRFAGLSGGLRGPRMVIPATPVPENDEDRQSRTDKLKLSNVEHITKEATQSLKCAALGIGGKITATAGRTD